MGDYTYRTREEVAAWRERCPIKRLRAELLEKKLATQAELDAIDAEITAEVTAASQAAEQAALPDATAATTHVYSLETGDKDQELAQSPNPGQREISSVAATVEALDYEMARNPGIFVLGEGIGVRGGNFGTTAGLFAKYGADRKSVV